MVIDFGNLSLFCLFQTQKRKRNTKKKKTNHNTHNILAGLIKAVVLQLLQPQRKADEI